MSYKKEFNNNTQSEFGGAQGGLIARSVLRCALCLSFAAGAFAQSAPDSADGRLSMGVNARAIVQRTFKNASKVQVPPSVPAQFQSIYSTVSTDITNFQTTVDSAWDRSPYPVVYSAQLQSGDSDLTTGLLAANYYQYTVLSELNDLQALGVQAVTFHVNFPALYQPYYTNPGDYQSYLNFYTQLVGEIHRRGLKVIIENTNAVVYPGNNSQAFVPYFQTLDWPTYQAQRAQLAASIAQLLRPDYLVVVAEPDTEAMATGQTQAGTVSGSTQMVTGMLNAISATGVTGVQVGAGCGSWDASFLQFEQSFAAMPLNFVDMHIYPVNGNFLTNAITAAGQIAAAGKQVTISEMWANKEADNEVTSLSYTDVFARNAFSFWAPLDASFLSAMSDFANAKHLTFVSPFWSQYFATYLDYNTDGSQSDNAVIGDVSTAVGTAHSLGLYTSTGVGYEQLVTGSQDTAAPQVPAPPASLGVSQTTAYLDWPPTTDNVGVAGYNVYRNGVLVGTVNNPQSFPDQGLVASTSYSYTITAFDATGNVSAPSAPLTITTLPNPDYTAPSVPTGLAASAISDTQVGLSWKPSNDNVGVVGYQIFRGTSPSSLTLWANAATNSFTDTKAAPATKYYYAVNAYDAFYNFSANSATASVTTLADTTPPTMPGNLSATTTPTSVTLSWTPSVDDYAVASYSVYRGSTSSNLQLMTVVPNSATGYTDTKVTSGKTYYYSVVASDVAKNLSTMPTPIAVTVH